MFQRDTFNISESSLDGIDSHRKQNKNPSELLLQIQEIPIYARSLTLFNLIGMIFAIVIGVFGILLKLKSLNLMGVLLIVTGIVLLIIFSFGIYSANSYSKASESETNLENLDQSFERTLVNIFMYFLMLFIIIFSILIIICLAYKSDLSSFIDQLAYNKKEWELIFAKLTYTEVKSNCDSIINIFGYICIGFSVFNMIGLILCFNMLDVYRSFQTIVQFFCILFIAIGLLLLYVAGLAYVYIDVINEDKNIPEWFPSALFFLGIFTILMAILGYIAHQAENKGCLQVFGFITTLFTIVIMVMMIVGYLFGSEVRAFFFNKCNVLVDLVDQEFLKKNIGCTQKYLDIKPSMDLLSCPKNRILYVWEMNLNVDYEKQTDNWGCIDQECCSKTLSAISNSSTGISVIATILFISGLIMTIGTIYVYKQLSSGYEKPPNYKSNVERISLIIFLIIIIGIVTAMITSLPEKPKSYNSSTDIVVKSNNSDTRINPNIITGIVNITNESKEEKKNITDGIKNETKISESNNCKTDCPVIKYYYTLSSADGTFSRNSTIDFNKKNITVTEEKLNIIDKRFYVKFEGNVADLNGYTEYFIFEHKCPLLPAKIKIDIIAKALPRNSTARRNLVYLNSEEKDFSQIKLSNIKLNSKNFRNLQNATNTTINAEIKGITVDVSNMKVNETKDVYSKEIDFSFVTNKTQVVTGSLWEVVNLSDVKPLNQTKVTITSLDFGQCSPQVYLTNEQGEFRSTQLYVFDQGLKTEYLIQVAQPENKTLTTFKKKFTVGGFGYTDVIDFGSIRLWSPTMAEIVAFEGITLDALTNKPLANVKVAIYNGTLSENCDLLNPSFTFNNITDKDVGLMKFTNSNDKGNYVLPELGPGRYTILLEKDGYYVEYFYTEILGKLSRNNRTTALSPFVEKGKVRFVLSWLDAPRDLDFHALYKTGKFSKCEVYFGKLECSGTSLDVNNYLGGRRGVESLTINTMGNYNYSIVVHKYNDKSGGKSPLDNKIDDAPILLPAEEQPDKLADIKLVESKAKVSVYINGYRRAIKELTIPENPVGNYLDEKKDTIAGKTHDYWLAFCLDGKLGIQSLNAANRISSDKPDYGVCEKFYPTAGKA